MLTRALLMTSSLSEGFRYVELTFPKQPDYAGGVSLESLEFVVIRSSVDLAGDLTVSDPMLQHVHHNYLYGQASNLMMVPSDCDNRDERFGWTGDSSLTADEASLNFDLSSFYDNWARMLDDSAQNGAVACWVPGGVGHSSPPAGGSCDASWGSAYPSVVWALVKWSGDVLAPQRYWTGLARFIDNEYGRTLPKGNSTQHDVKNIFSGLGDWVPPKTSVDNPSFKSEPRGDSKYAAGVAFLRNVRQMKEMASVGGLGDVEVAKYTSMFSEVCKLWHAAWWNATTHVYESGSQTASVLALEISECMPDATVKSAVVDSLVANIRAHDNHTTSGIIGWRFQPEALSNNGQAALAYALMTQTTYPSIGYEIIGKSGEPATTLWELWDSDVEGPSMNSRNHIMFGGNGKWLHTYVGGVDNAPGSVGFDHVLFAPPAGLLEQAVNGAAGGSTSSPPLVWGTATKATPKGAVEHSYRLQQSSSVATVGTGSGDGYTGLYVHVAAPANTVGTTVVPLLGSDPTKSTIADSTGAGQVWAAGAFVGQGIAGITGASLDAGKDAVVIEHGSGVYDFVLTFSK